MSDLHTRTLKSCWRQDDNDFIADLGTIPKSVIVACIISLKGHYYCISKRSYFPFTREQYDMRFNNHFDAIDVAEKHIVGFVQSLFPKAEEQHLLDIEEQHE